MPRKKGTNEIFKGITIEKSSFDTIHKHKYPGEPLYQTVHRILSIYDRDIELQSAHFMLEEYKGIMQKQVIRIGELEAERKTLEKMEKYI